MRTCRHASTPNRVCMQALIYACILTRTLELPCNGSPSLLHASKRLECTSYVMDVAANDAGPIDRGAVDAAPLCTAPSSMVCTHRNVRISHTCH